MRSGIHGVIRPRNATDLRSLIRQVPIEINQRESVRVLDFEIHPSWFHAYQIRAWYEDRAVIAICAAWQSGKTVFLPHWLKREIQRKGPGDYGAFSSTYKLLSRKFLPELKKAFEGLAEYRASDMQFILTEQGSRLFWGSKWNGEPTVIQLGYAENPDSLESATMKAVVWDEPGQRLVPEQSYLTVESRLMVNRGRMALASRPYDTGWYEQLVKSERPDVGVISFPSWANPVNPVEDDEYWDALRGRMPTWKFTILYEGKFTRPLGLIYDCFEYDRDTCEDFPILKTWNIYPGVDFGGVNTAGVLVAEDPHSQELYVIHDYHRGVKMSTGDHVKGIKGTHRVSVGAGGSHQEEGWRESARSSGLYLDEPPNNDVEVQIQCVYEQLKGRKLKFFRKGAAKTIEDIQLMSREVDDEGEVTDKIANKAKWHRPDALRYIICKLRPPLNVKPTETKVVAHNKSSAPFVPSVNGSQKAPPRWDLTGKFTR